MALRHFSLAALAVLMAGLGAGVAAAQKADKLPVAEAPPASAPEPVAEVQSKKPMKKPLADARTKKPAKKPTVVKSAAQKPASAEPDVSALARRIESKDKPAVSEDGLVLQQFSSKQPATRVGEGTAKLSIGEVGKSQYGSFGSVDDPRFADDPLAEPTPIPPIGFKLKMDF